MPALTYPVVLHLVATENALKVVDLVGDEASNTTFENGDATVTIDVLVLHVDRE